MKVTVKYYLNVRVGKPSVNAPTYQYLAPGAVLEVDGVLYDGDKFEGIDKWFKDAVGNYYWSGGIEKQRKDLSFSIQNLSAAQALSDIPNLIRLNGGYSLTSNGLGGVVAVLDSGISNKEIQSKIINEKNFVKELPDARDSYGHGTKVAGIISGDNSIIKSLSSKCSIINFKVADQNGVVTSDPVYYALDELSKLTSVVDVVNMSFDIPSKLLPFIQPIIDRLLENGTITVVAAGNGNSLNSIASLQNVIKVGAFKKEDFVQIKQSLLNKAYHCAFVDAPINSTDYNEKEGVIDQVSAYTALVSSMICAFLKNANNPVVGQQKLAMVTGFLTGCSFSLSHQDFPEDFKPFIL